MQQKKIVRVGDIECGTDELFLISGPCVIEDEKIMMTVAERLKEISERLGIKIIYKSSFMKDNRSSLDYYMGPGLEEGMRILAKVKEQFGFTLLTDVHYPEQCAPVAVLCATAARAAPMAPLPTAPSSREWSLLVASAGVFPRVHRAKSRGKTR